MKTSHVILLFVALFAIGIQNSHFKSYAGAGHTVQWEMPKEVAADIRDFTNSN